MASALSDAIRADLRCGPETAEDLARRARKHLAGLLGSMEDTDEDIVLRIQDPRVLGGFAESLLSDRDVPNDARVAVIERVFDLLPLPRTEGEVILVRDRSPSRLLSLAAFLGEQEGLTVLHAMHLVYAVFLDRSLLTQVPRATRTAVLHRVLRLGESTERLRLLYGALHLGSVPEPEAHDALRATLRSRDLSDAFKERLAALVSGDDGGLAALAQLAQDEGLLPAEPGDSDALGVLTNLPRMPSRLAPLGRRWVDRHGRRGRKRADR